MLVYRIVFISCCVALLLACSRAAPAELIYSERAFAKRAEQAVPQAVVYVYTPGGISQADADEHMNLIRQADGASTISQVMPLLGEAAVSTGYEVSAVRGRDDALCSWRSIPVGAERVVSVVAARGERTVQLQHVARNRAGNEIDASCANAAEVASVLDLTLASVP